MTLTIFSAPKPFTDPRIAIIQRNAIQSWMHLGAGVQVILVGQENGLAEVAQELGATHLHDVARNDQGTPLISSIFSLARQASQGGLLAYLNADILITPDFVPHCLEIAQQAKEFLLVGQRWDLEVTQELDFSPGWEQRLRQDVQARGQLHPPQGSDYFVYPPQIFDHIPDFAVGRAGWDNWMIYHARKQGWKVIDGTPSLMVVHQNHDYSHLPGGRPHYDLQESQHNMALGGGLAHMYTILDADYQYIDGRLRKAPLTPLRLLRILERSLIPKDGRLRGLRGGMARRVRRLRRKFSRDMHPSGDN